MKKIAAGGSAPKKFMAPHMLAALCCAALVAACTNAGDSSSDSARESAQQSQQGNDADTDAKVTPEPQVVEELDHSGVAASQQFFASSDTVVVADTSAAAQLRAASIGVAVGAPVLMDTGTNGADLRAEVERLGASTVLVVHNARFDAPEKVTVVTDPGGEEALKQLTGKDVDSRDAANIDEAVSGVASSSGDKIVLLQPTWEPTPPGADAGGADATGEVSHLPTDHSTNDTSAQVVAATKESSISAVATARAAGMDVYFLDRPDLRSNEELWKKSQSNSVVLLGQQFGSADYVNNVLAFKGETFLPNKRMVALYGNPISPALGVMGERPPAESAAEAARLAEEYQKFSDQPVVPAFEIIATVAHTEPGPDGDYSTETDVEAIRPYVDAITEVGGYAVIDLQPGRGSFVKQAQHYQELLERPNVGLALDPEWKIGPNEQPLARVGNTTAAEINETAAWLAQLVREKNLPQKLLILHQFQVGMIEHRDQVNVEHPELAFVLHIDGHGTPGEKMDTWHAMLAGLDPRVFVAWKNFIDEDHPTFSSEATMQVYPKPWFVSYQ